MNEDVSILDSVTRLLAVVIWPIVVVVVVRKLEPHLGVFLANLLEVSLKVAGVEISASRKQAEVAAALTVANVARFDGAGSSEAKAREAASAASLAVEVVTPAVIKKAERASVLWVDDQPAANALERKAIEALGVRLHMSSSTDNALAQLQATSFDLVISDMGRPPDTEAGLTLLSAMRNSGNRTPLIIYAGSRALEHQEVIRKHGGLGVTNRPDELFRMVVAALKNKA